MEKMRIDYFDIAKGIAIIRIAIGYLSLVEVNMVIFTFYYCLMLIETIRYFKIVK